MTQPISLFVDVPISAFRPYRSREYQDTYPVPPPATVYGMLLSLIGVEREQKDRFSGIKIAMAVSDADGPRKEIGKVFRKFRRVGQSKKDADPLADRRPDYQELILWLKLWLWIHDADASHSLTEEVQIALDPTKRHKILRYGGLSLGESTHLINEIQISEPQGQGQFLVVDNSGFLSMPVWTDHSANTTHLETFQLLELVKLPKTPDEEYWISIKP